MGKKTIMIIGAAEEHGLGIKAAHDMGLDVFVTDGNPDSPAFPIADAFAIASTYDAEATLDAAKRYTRNGGRIDGVLTLAADVPYTVAYVAENLGLVGIGIESALSASEKIRMKECFRREALPIPLFREVTDEKHLIGVAEEFGLPVVVKPVDSRGARGVQLIKKKEQLPAAYAKARNYSSAARVMVEEYLSGPQLSTEGFMLEGEACIPAIFDRNYHYLERFAPFIVEDGGEMPSRYSEQYRDEVHEVMKRAALALGITTGIIKGDFVIHNGRVKVIELAARMSGGFFATIATPTSCGVNLVEANIRLALGEKLNTTLLLPKWQRGAAIRFAFPMEGTVRAIRGWENVQQDPTCRYSHIFVKPGDRITPIRDHPSRPAVVVAEGETRQQAVTAAVRLMNQLQWEIEAG